MEESSVRHLMIAAVAPLAWGTTYLVTAELLPPDRPLLAATLRALPAGLLLLVLPRRARVRRLPTGDWWWRSAVLGLANIGLFFPLLFLGAYRLPGGLASTVQAMSPLVVMVIAWFVLRERAGSRRVVGGVVGAAGVALLVLGGGVEVDGVGLVGSIGSVVASGLGFVLIKRWVPPVDLLTLIGWQLVWGGLALVPVALVVEGPPPALSLTQVAGFVWLGAVGTVLAYACWFTALRHLPAGAVALVGLLNPVVGTALGVVVVHEVFGWTQALGSALVLGGVLVGQGLGGRARPLRTSSGASSRSHRPCSSPG